MAFSHARLLRSLGTARRIAFVLSMVILLVGGGFMAWHKTPEPVEAAVVSDYLDGSSTAIGTTETTIGTKSTTLAAGNNVIVVTIVLSRTTGTSSNTINAGDIKLKRGATVLASNEFAIGFGNTNQRATLTTHLVAQDLGAPANPQYDVTAITSVASSASAAVKLIIMSGLNSSSIAYTDGSSTTVPTSEVTLGSATATLSGNNIVIAVASFTNSNTTTTKSVAAGALKITSGASTLASNQFTASFNNNAAGLLYTKSYMLVAKDTGAAAGTTYSVKATSNDATAVSGEVKLLVVNGLTSAYQSSSGSVAVGTTETAIGSTFATGLPAGDNIVIAPTQIDNTTVSTISILASNERLKTSGVVQSNPYDINLGTVAPTGGRADSLLYKDSSASSNASYSVTALASATGANMESKILVISFGASATLTQRHYIFQQDNGADVNSNSADGSADTALTNVKKGERLIARFQVDNTGGQSWASGQFALQYDKNDNSWVNITASTELQPGYGLSGSHGDALTAAAAGTCTAGTTFGNGVWMSGSSWSSPLTIAASKCTEVSFVIDTSAATTAMTYRLRLYDHTNSKALDAYSVYPTVTIVNSSNDIIRASKDHIDRLGSPTSCTDANWDCMAVNSYNAADSQYDGRYNKMALDGNGNPWIVAQDNQNKQLVVNVYTPGAAASGQCSVNWVCTTVMSDGGTTEFGPGAVIKFDPSGTAWIAFQDFTHKYLYVAKYVGSGGSGCGASGSTAWTCTAVDNSGSVGGDFDLAFDASGNAWVVYENFSTGAELMANYSAGNAASGTCAVNWMCSTVATGVNASRGKLAIDSSGNKTIIYNAFSTGSISSVGIISSTPSGGTCAGSGGLWNCITLRSGLPNLLPVQTFIALDNSQTPWVAYHDTATSALVVANYVGSGGSSCNGTPSWTCTTVDNDIGGSTNTGDYPGLAFGPSGTLYASYTDSTTTAVKVAIRNGNGSGNCTSTAWNCSVVDSTAASIGNWTNIQIDPSGAPWVAYQDVTNGDTKVAKLRYPLGKGQLRYKLDNQGYGYIGSDDTNLDSLPATSFTPMYRFDVFESNNAIPFQPTWIGQSSIAASSDNIKLQVYRAGTTNAWVDLATNTTCAAATDCTITPSMVSTNLSEYYDQSGSQYLLHFRVYQVSGSSQTFKTDAFSVGYTPTADVQMRHGTWFNNGAKQPFTF